MSDVFRWEIPPTILSSAITRWGLSIINGLRSLMETFAARAQALAQQIAPWTDRTGAARQGIQGFVEASAAGATLYLVHGVFYGIFLELGTRFMGPRPAIQPALEQIYGPLMAAIRALVA